MQHVPHPVRFRKPEKRDINGTNPPYCLHRSNEGCDWLIGRLIGRKTGRYNCKSVWLVEHWCGTLTNCCDDTVLIMEEINGKVVDDIAEDMSSQKF